MAGARARPGSRLALSLNIYFFGSALLLWVMGIVYNVPPLRTKEWPYLDVLERVGQQPDPAAARLVRARDRTMSRRCRWPSPTGCSARSSWRMKRYAEYRHIGDPQVAAAYRRSFAYYTEERLLVSLVFYATACALFAGIFIVRYHLELILFAPLAAGVFAFYLHVGCSPTAPCRIRRSSTASGASSPT